jgi:bifunctional DNA-binding transcriptional regulator/antitoxin component of YhaV-PrlF toxin-antitoxin module
VDRVVGIRDGKTSSERVRRVLASASDVVAAAPDGAVASDSANDVQGAAVPTDSKPAPTPQESVTFHEYVVVDSAGRLQLPREYLEQLGISGRAQVELTEKGILIVPGKQDELAPSGVDYSAMAETWGPQRRSRGRKAGKKDKLQRVLQGNREGAGAEAAPKGRARP